MDEVQRRIDELERELRDSLENMVIGSVERGVAYERARDWIAGMVARMNAAPIEERCRIAWAIIVGEPRLPMPKYAQEHITDARFALAVGPDGEPTLSVSAQLYRPVETVHVSFTVIDPDQPLCKVCGLTQGDGLANHRGVVKDGVRPPAALGGSVDERGYYPHPFDPREDGDGVAGHD